MEIGSRFNNGSLDENPNFTGDVGNNDLLLPSSELDAGQSSFYFLHVIVYPGFNNQGIYINSATASANEGGSTVTDVSWDGRFNDSSTNPADNDPAVLVVCMPNGGCGPGQTSLGFDDSGWNGGSGWNDNSTSPQTWNDFDGMGNNITATLSGNNPSGGTPGPNVYTGNPFGCLNALRLTGSGSSTSLAQFPTETISFDDGIPFNQFFVGGMEAGRDDIDERAEISVVTFSNDGTELDPSTFTYTELTPSDVAYAFVGNSIYVWGTTPDSDGLLIIDLGGAEVDEVVWSVGEIEDNTVAPASFAFAGGNSSQWITPFCINEVISCNLTDGGLTGLTCDFNETAMNTADDFLTFSLNPQGVGLGATYNVSVSSGTISPTSGTYGSPAEFQLQDGSAGGGNVTVTITDVDDNMCTIDVPITDPGSCCVVNPTCLSATQYELDWSTVGFQNTNNSTPFPYTQTLTDIDGSGIDATITIEQDMSDNDQVGCGDCSFGVITPYNNGSPDILRQFYQNNNQFNLTTISFSENIQDRQLCFWWNPILRKWLRCSRSNLLGWPERYWK